MKKSFSILILNALILSSCSSVLETPSEEAATPPASNSDTKPATITDTVEESAEVKKLKEEAQKMEEAVKSQSNGKDPIKVRDQAMKSKDKSLCDDISDIILKKACVYDVIVEKAIGSKDKTVCKELSDDSEVTTCENLLDK